MNAPPCSQNFTSMLKRCLGVAWASIMTTRADTIDTEADNHEFRICKSVFSTAAAPGGGMVGSDNDTGVRGPEHNLVLPFPRLRTFPAHPWVSLERTVSQIR